MLRSSLDEDPNGKEKDDSNGKKATQSLSCDKCNATDFPNLSKLNKHRNTHEKPYECHAAGCKDAFAQKQALDRHTQTKHSDTIAKYYHCTVDGCKYSSKGRRAKRFARPDQVKEHIKDYGHYGPHSANNRPRRRADWTPIYKLKEHIITARFEEWKSDEGSPRRTIQLYQYNSLDTKLWHEDDLGELYVRNGLAEDAMFAKECPAVDCYFRIRPPDGCESVLFKTAKALEEHYRRSHQAETTDLVLPSHLQAEENCGSVSDSNIIEPSTYSLSNISLTSTAQGFQDSPQDLTSDMLGIEPDGFMQPLTCQAGQEGICFCQSCSQDESATTLEPLYVDLLPRHHFLGMTSEYQFTSLSPSSSTYETNFTTSNLSENTTRNLSTASVNSSTSLTRKDSPKSSRRSCSLPGCGKTFRRKYELQRHIEEIHTHSSRCCCPFCEREFPRKDKLKDHLRRHHSTSADIESTKMKTMFTDEWSSVADGVQWSSAKHTPGKDVAPADTLMKSGFNRGSWTDSLPFLPEVSSSRGEPFEMGWSFEAPTSKRRHHSSAVSPNMVEDEDFASWCEAQFDPPKSEEPVISSF